MTEALETVEAVALGDVEEAARRVLPSDVWDFVAGGSGAERTLDANRACLDRLWLVPRVLAGVAEATTACDLLGVPVSMPVAVAPMAYHGLVHPDGEVAMARAARAAGTVLAVSVFSSRTVEEIAREGAALWFQLYWLRDRSRTEELIGRAEAAGCRALVVTVDLPVMGRRLRDVRNRFTIPASVTAAHLPTEAGELSPAGQAGDLVDPSFGWVDLEWIRARTRLPLVVKGVSHPGDAVRAVAVGADALVVSNHGGRQLDGALPSAAALPAVLRAVAGRCPVYLDSGVRGGVDMLKALALGANGVLLGRPALWGLAVGGASGATAVLDLVRTELAQAMVLAGCADLGGVARLDVAGESW